MTAAKAWQLGFSLIVLFIVLSELAGALHDYQLARIGINRDVLLTSLWGLPLVAAFLASYCSKRPKFWLGLSFALVLPLLGAPRRTLGDVRHGGGRTPSE